MSVFRCVDDCVCLYVCVTNVCVCVTGVCVYDMCVWVIGVCV